MAGLQQVEYITSSRGSVQVLFQGYLYYKNKQSQACTYWRCTEKTCNGKCTTVGDNVRNVTDYDHPQEDVRRLRFVSKLRKRARDEPTSTMPSIYNDEVTQLDAAAVGTLPSFPSVESAFYRHRSHSIPKLPKNRTDVNLTAPWTDTCDGERFLLFSDGEDDKMLVFSTDEQLRVLQTATVIYMDGTFTACPDLWNQLYILHVRRGTTTFPLVYALLPDRRQATYQRLFSNLKMYVQQLFNQPLNPDKFQVDFEMAAIRGIELEFPAAEVKGCFFNYTQAIWRKTQELGLAVMYREDPLVERWVRRAAALPLLPLQQVQDAWLDTMNSCPDVPGSETFNDYVTATWLDDDARFTLPMWNHHDTFGPRTNNNIEGFHSRLNASLSHRHPNIFRFMEIIKKIEKAEKTKLCQLDLGGASRPRKRVYREVDNRLHRLKDQLASGMKDPMQYLDAVGKLLKLR